METDVARIVYQAIFDFCLGQTEQKDIDAIGFTAVKLLVKDVANDPDSKLSREQLPEVYDYIKDLKKLDDDSTDFSIDWLSEYAKQRRVGNLLKETGQLLRDGGSASSAINFFIDTASSSVSAEESEDAKPADLETGFGSRFLDRRHALSSGDVLTIPLGFPLLDASLEGGIRTNEILMMMGHTGVGKSFLADTIGVNIYLAGYNVLKITTENTKEQSLGRTESILYRLNYRMLQNCSKEIDVAKLMSKRRSPAQHKTIRLFPEQFSVGDVFRQINRMRMTDGFDPAVIIFDSPDFLKADTQRGLIKKRHEVLTEIYQSLKSWIETYKKCVITTSHVKMGEYKGRRGKRNDRLDVGDGADSSGKVRLSDTVITLNVNQELMDLGKMELYVAKGRDITRGAFSVIVKRAKNYPGFIECPDQ